LSWLCFEELSPQTLVLLSFIVGKLDLDILVLSRMLVFGNLRSTILMPLGWLIFGKLGLENLVA
jgi:hypothetical protein